MSSPDPSVPLARARVTVDHLLVMVADFGRNAGGQVKLSRNASAARLSASEGACNAAHPWSRAPLVLVPSAQLTMLPAIRQASRLAMDQ